MIEQSWVDMEMRCRCSIMATLCKPDETAGSRKAYEDLTGLDEQVLSAAQEQSLPVCHRSGNTYTAVIDPILQWFICPQKPLVIFPEADMTRTRVAGSCLNRASVWTEELQIFYRCTRGLSRRLLLRRRGTPPPLPS